jgi:hypothetical protein
VQFLFLVNSIVAWMLLSGWAIQWLQKRLENVPYYHLECPEGACYGTLATYRITFTSTLFHLIMAGLTYNVRSSSDMRAGLQNGYWIFKIAAYGLLMFAAWSIPNSFFLTYASIAMFFSGLFIIIQLMFLVDFAYRVRFGVFSASFKATASGCLKHTKIQTISAISTRSALGRF